MTGIYLETYSTSSCCQLSSGMSFIDLNTACLVAAQHGTALEACKSKSELAFLL